MFRKLLYIVSTLILVIFLMHNILNHNDSTKVEIDGDLEDLKDKIKELEMLVEEREKSLKELELYLEQHKKIIERTGLDFHTVNELIIQTNKRDIPIDKVLGLIEYESSFNPNAKNPKSTATGLGQILYGTGEWLASMEGLEFKEEYLKDPVYNVRLIVTYLEYLDNKNDGDWIKTLFNYGDQTEQYPYRVLSRAEKYKDLDY